MAEEIEVRNRWSALGERLSRIAKDFWIPEIVYFLTAIVVIGPLLPSGMRETDQASLVWGALRIAHGASIFLANFYHYDKMFGSYWLLAAVYKLLPKFSPVSVANIVQMVLWCFASYRIFAQARRCPTPAQIFLSAALLSPVWMLNAPFLSPAALSSYVIVLAFLVRRRHLAGCIYLFVLVFAATSFRADAILVVPFLIWCHQPRIRFRSMILRLSSMAIIAGAVIPLFIGIAVAGGSSEDSTPPKIIPKVIAAFTVFGMGSAAVVFLLVFLALITVGARKRWTWYYVFGALSFLIPFFYYGVQLLSPRYLLLTVTVSACAVCNRRVLAVLQQGSLSIAVIPGLPVVALVPLFIGLSLPTLKTPRLRISSPTTYPTADGHWPMGGIIEFAWSSHRRDGIYIDHNEAIFASVQATDFSHRCDGAVPVFFTPMFSMFQLGLELKGIAIKRIPALPAENCEFVYADLRSITHHWLHPFEADRSPQTIPPLTIASPADSEQPIVLIGVESSPQLRHELTVMRQAFQGREFQLISPSAMFLAKRGDTYNIVSESPFVGASTCLGNRTALPESRPDGQSYLASFTTMNEGCIVQVEGTNFLVGKNSLQNYMEIH